MTYIARIWEQTANFFMGYWWLLPAFAFALLAVIFMAVWVNKDAKARGMNAGLWTFLTLGATNCSGAVLYLLGRKRKGAQAVSAAHRQYMVAFLVCIGGMLLGFALVAYQMVSRGMLG